jgi:transposase/DNA replication protein DnaC
LGYQQIGRSCAIGVSTVHKYLKRAEAAGLTWPLPEDWDEARVEATVFPHLKSRAGQVQATRSRPDFASFHEQLRRHRHLTLQLLWEEYREANPDGYRYSRFCELYQRWRSKLDVVLRQEHKAGEKMFIDCAGATIPVHDRLTGQAWSASLFVAALGASCYTWAEATRDQQMESWLRAHVHAFEYWGGIPALAVPDNTKTGVTKAHRYDPDLNPTYYNFALHCGFGIVPARPYKPRDKAKVENAVQVAQRWIVAALRHRKFFALEDLNVAIGELLEKLNHRPFRKREGSRATVFEALDKPALKPVPTEPFDLSEWSRARVNIDYHVAFDANLYSVPYNLVHELVEIRSTPTTVEILHKGTRVASHLRSRGRGQAVTNDEHRPKSHSAHLEWTPSRMAHWAETIGPNTARLFERIMNDKPHPEMGYRGCLGIIRLAQKYSAQRVEAAAERALITGACRYKSVESILKNSLDRQPLPHRRHRHPLLHRNTTISAARSTSSKAMLQEPMMEKLTAMRLLGMVDALKAQEQDPGSRELSFLERLGLLVDQQWTWRENQALARRLYVAKLKGGACVEDIDYRTSRGLDKSVIRALAQKSAWVTNHENIFVLGPTGVGKSFVACALAQKACRDGYSALYTRAAALFRDLAMARADGSLRSLLTKLSRIDVLVIDDWAMAPLGEAERRDFWEICEDRYQTRSTILTSQLPVTRWHEQIGDPTAADGILDRLVHNAHRIEMRGDSMRKKRGTQPSS